VTLAVDEYEVIRLVDWEGMTHEQCAVQMQISRTTVTEICQTARRKIADSLVNGKSLVITGGNYQICHDSSCPNCRRVCQRLASSPENLYEKKGSGMMRIAVPFDNGMIYQHFGHTEQFKIYDAENGQIVKDQLVSAAGSGHGALAGFLTGLQVDTLICGGIGAGAQTALAEAGIQLFGGVSGDADGAVRSFLDGHLDYQPDVRCSHHDHQHGSCGSGGCGEDKHGCTGNGHKG